jgi:shikimate dehydrogenase
MTLQALDKSTMYFIGVTTGKSSMMNIFPKWVRILGTDTELAGYDAPLHAPAEIYREIVGHIKRDPLAVGGLVTTHKIDLLAATRDLFDYLDPYAEQLGEISCICKQDGRLEGYARDPISSRLSWEAFVPPGHWSQTGGQVMCIGAGGAASAISLQAAGLEDRPAKFTIIDISQERLDHLRDIHATLDTDIQFDYILNGDARKNDELMTGLPAGSMVINATGMGKDRPGSPVTDEGIFPGNGLVWELNYRGELEFLHQAKRQAERRGLHIEDGWVYFLHGWAQVVAKVFHVDITPEQFEQLGQAAASAR